MHRRVRARGVRRQFAAGPRPDGRASVVIALRADFYAHCAQYASLREAVAQHQEYVGPMTGRSCDEPSKDQWSGAVGPSSRGWRIAVARSWRRAWGAAATVACTAGNLAVRRGRRLTLAGYAESGGVQGAIAQTAERVRRPANSHGQATDRPSHLPPTDGTRRGDRWTPAATRAVAEMVAHRNEEPDVRAVLQLLADARLVTLGTSKQWRSRTRR